MHVCLFFFHSGIICTCEKLGERASETSQSKHCNSFGWKQGRPCQQESAGLSGLRCLNRHRGADASCWLYKWDVELFINKQTCHADFQSLRTVSFGSQDAQSYADDNSLLFMETSAKTSMNVNEIFMAIGKFINQFDSTFLVNHSRIGVISSVFIFLLRNTVKPVK